MNILVVSPRPPWPPNKADAMTVDYMVRFLANREHQIDLICFVENENEDQMLKEGFSQICRSIDTVILPRWKSVAITALGLLSPLPMQVQYYRSKKMEQLLSRKVEMGDYDIVYTHLIRMAEYARKLKIPKVLGIQISQALNLERMVKYNSNPFQRMFYRVELSKVRPYEANVSQEFDRVFLCGKADIDSLGKTIPIPNAVVCPHGQDIPPLENVRNMKKISGAIAMSGVMSTHTNVEAITWFVKEVFPLVLEAFPEAEFWIIGRNPSRQVQNLENYPNVKVTGEVPNIYEWLAKASIAVAPVRVAAGMQNKIVQAMACELPVVSTTAANEGINAKPGEQIIVKDNPREFSEAVIDLLHNYKKREKLGKAARKFVERYWSWEYHFEKQEKIFIDVAEKYESLRNIIR
jgi:glycosyltransferase involved in cell wall biosynthesis